MTSSRSPIIRGAQIDGVKFCTPVGDVDSENPVDRQEKQHLKTLEDYWYNKGRTEGEKEGFEKGLEQGELRGRTKGAEEGELIGAAAVESHAYFKGQWVGAAGAQQTLNAALTLSEKVACAIKEEQQRLVEHARPEMIQFCLKVCEKVLRQRLEDEQALKSMLEMVLQQARSISTQSMITVHLHPDDFTLLEPHFTAGTIEHDAEQQLRYMADGSVPRAGCRVETPLGLVNFDIQRLMRGLEQKVLEVHPEEDELPENGLAADIHFEEDAEINKPSPGRESQS